MFSSDDTSSTRLAIDTALEAIYSQFASKLQLDRDLIHADDLFIAKYDATVPGRQTHLDAHQDKQMLSFVIALNDDFTDGGTYFFATEELWRALPGSAILFHGMHWHAGIQTYIINAFNISDCAYMMDMI